MKVLLLSADRYEFTNESTGEVLRGSTLFYLNNYREKTRDTVGLKPTKVSSSVDVFNDIHKNEITLPAFAEISIETRPGAQGKASIVVTSVDLIGQAEVF